MKLSEAIRLGAMLKPQYTNGLTRDDDGSCALGAALDAVGCAAPGFLIVMDLWPIACVPVISPDGGSGEPFPLAAIVAFLNDHRKWTREAIADWVETIEDQQAPQKQPQISEVVTA